MKVLKFVLFSTFLLTMSPSSVAVADQTKVKSKVASVTLYRNQAMVTRTLVLDGAAGVRELVVEDLPENIQPSSLFAEGGEKVEVRAVRFRTRASGESPRKEVREIEEKLRANQQAIQLVTVSYTHLTLPTTYSV